MATPMMAQYFAVKEQYPDAIIFFRLGDFYEMFGEDAETASRILDIVLTSREAGSMGRIPMCGVPYHSAESYIATLVANGHKVAICEQLQDPKEAKGLVERGVIRVVTPGTVIGEAFLNDRANNYLVAVTRARSGYGLAVCDASTGEFQVTEFSGAAALDQLLTELARLAPAECLLGPGIASDETVSSAIARYCRTAAPYDERAFQYDAAYRRLTEHFGVHSLDGFGCQGLSLAVQAAGAVLQYLQETQKTAATQIAGLSTYSTAAHMTLDAATRRTLELTRTWRDGAVRGSLLWVLDATQTSMGARLLRRWLDQPLLNKEAIQERLDAVEALAEHHDVRTAVRDILRHVADVERLLGRIAYKTATARDLVALRTSLEQIPRLRALLEQSGLAGGPLRNVAALDDLSDIAADIAATLVDEPPATVKEGGLIRPGFHAEVDQLRTAGRKGKQWIAELEETERQRTGIKSLKVGFNKVFGYYIEVTRPNLHLVPDDYERKQTLANAERFITPALKEQEALILNAEDRVVELEYELFVQLRERVAARTGAIQAVARQVAQLDVLAALAHVAVERGWVKPVIDEELRIDIRGGRHPVVEAMVSDGSFVPNDTFLDENQRLIILTGPNMAGKSTYLRQVALIVLLAQVGSFVPARSAAIGLVDRIFTRIGAADDLGTGQSTFMVEMNEAANILHHATERSLVVIDELGRGTSTYDGMALTQAIAEHIHHRIGARTLISTHYHELTRLPDYLPRARNYRTEVAEHRGRIRFLYTVVPGGADRSYGLNVARMAGIPAEVIQRARKLLQELEQGKPRATQLDLFSAWPETAPAEADFSAQLAEDEIISHLRRLDIPRLTPLEALNLLADWQAKLTAAE